MRRRLFTWLSALSLTLCLAVVAGWAWAVASPSAGRAAAVVGGHHLFLDQDRLVAVGLVDVRLPPGGAADVDAALSADVRRAFADRWAAQLVPPADWSMLGAGWDVRRMPLPPTWGPMAVASSGPPAAGTPTPVLTVRTVQVPFWPACAATALLPAVWLTRAARRRRRRRAGRCEACGYNLRGSPGRCPECGAEPGRRGALTDTPNHARV